MAWLLKHETPSFVITFSKFILADIDLCLHEFSHHNMNFLKSWEHSGSHVGNSCEFKFVRVNHVFTMELRMF